MVLDDLAAFLVGEGLGTLAGDLFLSSAATVPEVDTAVVQLYEYGGLPPLFVHPLASIAVDLPRVQVLVRAKSYATARARAEAVYQALGRLVNAVAGSARYLRVTPQQAPFDAGPDEHGRAQVVFNCQVERINP